MKYLNTQKNTETDDSFVPISQIEYTLKYASFAIASKENITDRNDTLSIRLPYLLSASLPIQNHYPGGDLGPSCPFQKYFKNIRRASIHLKIAWFCIV